MCFTKTDFSTKLKITKKQQNSQETYSGQNNYNLNLFLDLEPTDEIQSVISWCILHKKGKAFSIWQGLIWMADFV